MVISIARWRAACRLSGSSTAPASRSPLCEGEGKILDTTIGRYKESDVILLVDIDPADERCDRPARYVAVSRARHVLHVWAKGGWVG